MQMKNNTVSKLELLNKFATAPGHLQGEKGKQEDIAPLGLEPQVTGVGVSEGVWCLSPPVLLSGEGRASGPGCRQQRKMSVVPGHKVLLEKPIP